VKTESLDLFIFADALGWTLARDRRFMEDLFPYRQACDTLFGYSCTCDPSILTGCIPEEHGHFSFFVQAREKASPFGWTRYLGWLPEALAGHHRIRNRVSRWTARANGYTGYFQLYSVPFSKLRFLDYTEKHDIYEPGGILGGQPTIFEHWKESGLPWMRSDWRRDDASNVAHLKEKLLEGKVRLAYLFTSGLDATMHAHTTAGPEVDAAFARFEKWLREIYEIAGRRYETVRLHLFSDHGMTNTRQTSRMMLDFAKLGLQYGRDYVAVWDSTMARLWFPAGSADRVRVEEWFRAQTGGRVVTDEELKKWGCHFPDGRYGELIYLLDNGIIFAPSFMNQHRVPAMHGFDPAEPDSAACWLTNYPCPDPPKRLEDIFDVMLRAASRGAELLTAN
jgi:hypothetical protein